MDNVKKLKVTFLGTGTSQGVPVIGCKCMVCSSPDHKDKRLRSSVLIEIEGTTLIIDTGPDFRQQMLLNRVDRLDGVLFTHEHRDHVAGLDDIRAFNFLQQQPMDVYAEERVIRALNIEFPYIFTDKKYPGIPQLHVNKITNRKFNINGISITPIRVMHLHLPVLGFRIGNFAYITDANHISVEEMEKLEGLNCLVINSLRKEKHISHYNFEEALNLIQMLKPKLAYLTHLSHQMGRHSEVEKELPDHVLLAFDGLTMNFE